MRLSLPALKGLGFPAEEFMIKIVPSMFVSSPVAIDHEIRLNRIRAVAVPDFDAIQMIQRQPS